MSDTSSTGDEVVPAEFERFYRRHAESLLVFFARRTLDADLALELTAETFAIAYVKRRKFRGHRTDQAAAWLYAIARSQLQRFHRRGAIDHRSLQRLGLELPSYSDGDVERVEQLADLESLRSEVGVLFADLPDHQRVAVQLRVVEERSYEEIASRLMITEQTARARVSRGLRALRCQMPDVPKEMLT